MSQMTDTNHTVHKSCPCMTLITRIKKLCPRDRPTFICAQLSTIIFFLKFLRNIVLNINPSDKKSKLIFSQGKPICRDYFDNNLIILISPLCNPFLVDIKPLKIISKWWFVRSPASLQLFTLEWLRRIPFPAFSIKILMKCCSKLHDSSIVLTPQTLVTIADLTPKTQLRYFSLLLLSRRVADARTPSTSVLSHQ